MRGNAAVGLTSILNRGQFFPVWRIQPFNLGWAKLSISGQERGPKGQSPGPKGLTAGAGFFGKGAASPLGERS